MTFADPVPQFSKDQLDQILVSAQEHSRLLNDIERNMNASKEYLTKVCSIVTVSYNMRAWLIPCDCRR